MAKDINQKTNLSSILTEDKPSTKVNILARLTEVSGLPKKKIDELLFQHFPQIIQEDLNKGFVFTWPGLLKIYPVVKPSTPEREGKNPFTKELTVFKAKPAYKTVRVKPLKKLKEMAGGPITE